MIQRGARIVADDGSLNVVDLHAEQFRQAYPLIQSSATKWTLDQWLKYANDLCSDPDDRGGILSIQNSARHIFAVAAYRIKTSQSRDRILQVEHLCMVSLFNGLIGPPLVQALENRGQEEDCLEVRVNAPETHHDVGWLSRQLPGGLLRKLGFDLKDDVLTKTLD